MREFLRNKPCSPTVIIKGSWTLCSEMSQCESGQRWKCVLEIKIFVFNKVRHRQLNVSLKGGDGWTLWGLVLGDVKFHGTKSLQVTKLKVQVKFSELKGTTGGTSSYI